MPEIGVPFAASVALWSLTLNRPPRVSLIGLASVLALTAVSFITVPYDDAVFAMVVAVSVWALAEAARNRRTAIEEVARRAVADEQARIARELHDVIAHSVVGDRGASRGGGGRVRLAARPGARRPSIHRGRRTRRPARAAPPARRRPPGRVDAPMPPQPGLEQLDELAEPLRAAGLTVVVNREGPPSDLPAGVDLSAYRIVQEALTNTLRHARATVAEVTFRYRSDVLEIEVVDDGRGAPARAGGETGFGLVGMRERAALHGGSLEAGPDGPRRLSGARPPAVGLGVMTIRVVIADDQTLVRAGFRMILDARDDIEVVGEAEDGAEAVALVEALAPDVVLMDVRMTGVDGIEATRRIVGAGSPARIIILTTYDLDEYVFAALRAGASGFMLKDVRPVDLVEGVRVVARGDALLAASVTRRLLDRFVQALPDPADAPPDLGGADRAGGRGAAPRRLGTVQRRDRRAALPERSDGEDTRLGGAAQARPAGPGAGRGLCLRRRSGAAAVILTSHRKSVRPPDVCRRGDPYRRDACGTPSRSRVWPSASGPSRQSTT